MGTTTVLWQVRLKSGTEERTCWIDRDVTIGQSVKLKNEDPDTWWEVTWVSDTTTTAGAINRGWNNNI